MTHPVKAAGDLRPGRSGTASLRIAFLLDSFPILSETFILRQIAGLIDLGHEVDIFAERRPANVAMPVHEEVAQYDLLGRTTYMDIPRESGYWEMPVRPVMGKTWVPGENRPIRNVRRLLRAAPVFARCLRAAPGITFEVLDPSEFGIQAHSLSTLYRLGGLCARRARYDVAHAHFGPTGNAFRFVRRLWGAPLVVSFHGFDFCTFPRQHGLHVYGRLFQTADAVMVNSQYTRGRLVKLGCPPHKLRELPVGLNPDAFRPLVRAPRRGEPVRVLSIGRLVPIKGHQYAIRAVARLRDRLLNVRYDIVGEGPLRPTLETLIQELRLQGIVTLHGARPGGYVRDQLDAADVFVMPSVSVDGDEEGQGLALQEAQACGLPVIATNHGALPEGMIPGESGLIVPEGDVEALARALERLARQPESWPAMGSKGRTFVEQRFDIRRLNARLVAIYRDVVLGASEGTRSGGG